MQPIVISPDLWTTILRVLGAVVLFIANSLVVAVSRHPEWHTGFWAQLLRVLGRLSVLRHTDSPSTLHFPGFRQPAPELVLGAPLRKRWATPPAPPLALLLLAGVLTLACSPTLPATQRTLASGITEQTKALAAFAVWDRGHQLELVKASKTREEAAQKLTEYRAARAQLVDLVKQGAHALDSAATSLQQGVVALSSAGVSQ